ncbi:MAG: hypothetical protein ABI851_04705 [Saprospiraceae bacterium]
MKLSNLIGLFLTLCICLFFVACNQDNKTNNKIKSNAQPTNVVAPPNVSVPSNMTPVSGPPTQNLPAQNTKGIWHYKCPNTCQTGSGAAELCPKCATMMVHNQEYHNK